MVFTGKMGKVVNSQFIAVYFVIDISLHIMPHTLHKTAPTYGYKITSTMVNLCFGTKRKCVAPTLREPMAKRQDQASGENEPEHFC